jgi:stress-induced morphogen
MSLTLSLEQKIRSKLEHDVTYLRISDESGSGCDGGKFDAVIVSNRFDGVPLLERHTMINDAIADELKRIHAWSQKTWTEAQWVAKGKPE